MINLNLTRREFLSTYLGGAITVAMIGNLSAAGKKETSAEIIDKPLKKALILNMLPKNLSLEEQFRLAKRVGFDGVEVPPITDPETIKELREAADKTGLQIHSIIYGGWHAPLSSPEPKMVAEGLRGVEIALRSAKALGADAVLLVPAVVNAQVRYQEAYQRSQKNIRTLIPLAKELGVVIAVENVWNYFLLSPLEFARYVDEFKSPFVQAYFDVGNVVTFGWPQDWIRTLGRRIKKIHLKDFKRQTHSFVPLREGDVDWPEVRKALSEVGYTGFLTAELGGGDEPYLREVSLRIDKIIAGE